MGYYFSDSESIRVKHDGTVDSVLKVIAQRYMGNNPDYPYTMRPYQKSGIMRGKDYRYLADFTRIFPDSTSGMSTFVRGSYTAPAPLSLKFILIPYGPAVVYLNGQQIARTDLFSERDAGTEIPIDLDLHTGINDLVIKFTRTPAGFGGEFGTWLGKLDYYFLKPIAGFHEEEGFVYCAPFTDDGLEAVGVSYIEEHPQQWLPSHTWSEPEARKGQFARILGGRTGSAAVARTVGIFASTAGRQAEYHVTGSHEGSITLTIAGKKLLTQPGSGTFDLYAHIPYGQHPVVIVQENDVASSWGFSLTIEEKETGLPVRYENPLLSEKSNPTLSWIFSGPYDPHATDGTGEPDPNHLLTTCDGELSYWRLDYPDGWIRQYNENALFGHWNYPLGVTLFGLIETSRAFEDDAWGQALGHYVQSHVRSSVDNFAYALWDKEHFGGATAVHHLLTSIDSLDDCGSFGSLMLEVARDRNVGHDYKNIADYVANHILHKQIRLEDGTFFRKNLMHHFHEDTMWADDLYMSIPFLCRYAALTENNTVLDDAAAQFIGFKKRLYDPERRLMSHVYDFRRNMPTGVAWGRGNGWTIFSLSELLAVLPENHKLRGELLQFYRDLAEGYLATQDASGMWHQVLDMPSSYPETSCTAMFIYAFSHGIRQGWFPEPHKFRAACTQAWEALKSTSIDSSGNIHGVCRGSEFSFTPRYYAEELLPRLNDTHGIGIVLLAGVEMLRLNHQS